MKSSIMAPTLSNSGFEMQIALETTAPTVALFVLDEKNYHKNTEWKVKLTCIYEKDRHLGL